MRSFKSLENPLALTLAEKFQGGGHICAAGCKVSKNKFNSHFIRHPADKSKLTVSAEEI
jgi:nanoRNase/pAp phosphatase (c-di-AMP/oligoRNAs hydrolase)